jgi:hypothetical protein
MWGLRDACILHGLRCGSYVALTGQGWSVIGENRAGRTPNAASWSRRTAGPAPAALADRPAQPLPQTAAR